MDNERLLMALRITGPVTWEHGRGVWHILYGARVVDMDPTTFTFWVVNAYGDPVCDIDEHVAHALLERHLREWLQKHCRLDVIEVWDDGHYTVSRGHDVTGRGGTLLAALVAAVLAVGGKSDE